MSVKEPVVNNIFRFGIREKQKGDRIVSYSQYTKYATCPHSWKLQYIDGHRIDEPNIHLVFGEAFHKTLQTWLNVLYNDSIKAANSLDLGIMLYDNMVSDYNDRRERFGQDFSTSEQLAEFYNDGVDILNFITKHRVDYFSTKALRLVAVELPIYYEAMEGYNVFMMGFLDLVFENKYTGSLEVWDIKTSTNGWNKWQKADKTKTSQLILYKRFLAKQYNYPIQKIDVKYFIVRRKVDDSAMYPVKRVQQFVPASGTVTLKRTRDSFEGFIKNSFNKDGSYKTDSKFPAMAGKKAKNCRFCPFKDDFNLCPKENRHSI